MAQFSPASDKETWRGRKHQYAVTLSAEERSGLISVINKGTMGARQLKRAHMLLLSAEGKRAREIAPALQTAL
jgi:hypothetical protein